MPSGSRPLTGSSNIRIAGSPSSAAAMPSRWPMPRENPPARLPATCGQADQLQHLVDARRGGCRWSAPGTAGGCRRCGRRARPWPPAARRPRAAGTARRPYALPFTVTEPRVGPVQAEDQPHGGRLAGAVRAEEPGDLAGLDGEGQVVDGELVAVPLGEAPCLDHRWFPPRGRGHDARPPCQASLSGRPGLARRPRR